MKGYRVGGNGRDGGNSGNSGNSGDSGDSGDSGNSGNSGNVELGRDGLRGRRRVKGESLKCIIRVLHVERGCVAPGKQGLGILDGLGLARAEGDR